MTKLKSGDRCANGRPGDCTCPCDFHRAVVEEWAENGRLFQQMLDSGELDHYLGIVRRSSDV